MLEDLPLSLVENEYGVKHIDYWAPPDPKVVRHYVKEYNLNTHTKRGQKVHNACLNCQINQIEKYKDSNEYAVRTPKAPMRQEPTVKGKKVATLRAGQIVSILQRKGNWCRINTATIRGVCLEHQEKHPVVYSDDRAMMEQAHCLKCDSRLRIISERKEGWVEWEHLTFFKCPCKFIPSKYELPAKIKKTSTPEEQDKLLTYLDPVKWVREWTGLDPRDNQKLNLMCTSKNIVLREGRRAGKTWGECMSILHYCLTTEIHTGKDAEGNDVYRGPQVLVATPFLSQIELIFGIVDTMVSRNKAIRVIRRVKTPFHSIEFSNGSKIQGFTTGTNSKQEAGTVLGQAADVILLDEVDRMDTADITRAIRPIQITSPNVRLMVSSTPTGKREWFYNRSMADARFKEFFFPSTILPHWEEVKEEAEADGTHEHFLTEYMALFIAQIAGVYQPAYIAAAETAYTYNQREPYIGPDGIQIPIHQRNSTWYYTMGVDWNTNAGTEIIVVGMDRTTMHCWAVDALNVPKQDWQQTKAVDAIVKMNAKWTPDFVYVDRGYGACVGPETIIQTLDGCKTIKDIVPGDLVLTKSGHYKPVLDKCVAAPKTAYRIRPSKCLETIISEEHPFLTYRTINRFHDSSFDEEELSWRSCKEIDPELDFVAIPKTHRTSETKPSIIDLTEWIDMEGISYDDNHMWCDHGFSPNNPLSAKKLAIECDCGEATIRRARKTLKNGVTPTQPKQKEIASYLTDKYGLDWIHIQQVRFSRYLDVASHEFLLFLGWYLSEGSADPRFVELS